LSRIASDDALFASRGGRGVAVGLGIAGVGEGGAGLAMKVGAEVGTAITEEAVGVTEALGAGTWHAATTKRRMTTRRTLPSSTAYVASASEFPRPTYELRRRRPPAGTRTVKVRSLPPMR
jgi:hypothetical protein